MRPFTSTIGVRGYVRITELDVRTNTEHLVESGHNLVTASGISILIDRLLVAGVRGPIALFALGTGSTAAAASDTSLAALSGSYLPVARSTSSPPTLTVQLHITSTQYNGITIREAGLFDTSGLMFARYVLGTPYAKTNTRAVTFSWDITFTAS